MRPLSFATLRSQPTKRAVFIDVETTGLDAAKDGVIELPILPFDYIIDEAIVGVHEAFGSGDPGFPIPAEITALTGIDDFVEKAALVISHNAGFDRPFCEREWPI
jgi:DNA polymerase-3 subunit epsilon